MDGRPDGRTDRMDGWMDGAGEPPTPTTHSLTHSHSQRRQFLLRQFETRRDDSHCLPSAFCLSSMTTAAAAAESDDIAVRK